MIRSLPEGSKPILLPEKFDIARVPKSINGTAANGQEITVTNGISGKRKRGVDDVDPDDEQLRKRGKVFEEPFKGTADMIALDDSGNGAIIIDD